MSVSECIDTVYQQINIYKSVIVVNFFVSDPQIFELMDHLYICDFPFKFINENNIDLLHTFDKHKRMFIVELHAYESFLKNMGENIDTITVVLAIDCNIPKNSSEPKNVQKFSYCRTRK